MLLNFKIVLKKKEMVKTKKANILLPALMKFIIIELSKNLHLT